MYSKGVLGVKEQTSNGFVFSILSSPGNPAQHLQPAPCPSGPVFHIPSPFTHSHLPLQAGGGYLCCSQAYIRDFKNTFLLAYTSYTCGSYSSPHLSPFLCVPFQPSPLVLLLISFPSFPPFLFFFLSEFKVVHRSTGTSSWLHPWRKMSPHLLHVSSHGGTSLVPPLSSTTGPILFTRHLAMHWRLWEEAYRSDE